MIRQTLAGLVTIIGLSFGLFAVTAGAQSAEDDPTQIEAGMAVYEANCARCHGADGMGSDTGRSLVGIATEQPDRLVNVEAVTNGKSIMPAFGEELSTEEIDSAVSYVRLTFVEDAATSGPADETAEEAEPLAVTGAETLPLGILGASLLAGGAMIAHQLRRRTR